MTPSINKHTLLFGTILFAFLVLIPGLTHFAKSYHHMAIELATYRAKEAMRQTHALKAQVVDVAPATPKQATPSVPTQVKKVLPPSAADMQAKETRAIEVAALDQVALEEDLMATKGTPPPAPKVKAPLVTKIQMGSFTKLSLARSYLKRLEQSGFKAEHSVIIGDDGRPKSKVIVLVKGSNQAVTQAQAKLQKLFNSKGMILND